jgi:hypothetical protein
MSELAEKLKETIDNTNYIISNKHNFFFDLSKDTIIFSHYQINFEAF